MKWSDREIDLDPEDTAVENSQVVEPADSTTSVVSILIHQDASLKAEAPSEGEETFRASDELIRPDSSMERSGIVEPSQTVRVERVENAAVLLYRDASVADLSHNVRSMIIAATALSVEEPPFEKTKAPRISVKPSADSVGRRTPSQTNPPISQSDTAQSTAEVVTSTVPPVPAKSNENVKTAPKTTRRSSVKPAKEAESTYMSALTVALRTLFQQSTYDTAKLRKIHEELISSGHISPLNEFYRSINDALRVTLDHCLTYEDLIRWTLSLFRTHNKHNLIQFAHDLYGIAIDLDLKLVQGIDFARCSTELQENIQQQLQTLSEHDLRGRNVGDSGVRRTFSPFQRSIRI